MNDAQWLWCYFNAMQDQEEEEKQWKSRLDYLGWYINPEQAKSVMEQDEAEESQSSNKNYIKEGVFNNDEFDKEAKAAQLGYDPSSGLSPEEFLRQYFNKQSENQEVDIMNDDFDTLLASGQFTTVSNNDNSVGNSRESENDFLSRVSNMKEYAEQSFSSMQAPLAGEVMSEVSETDDLVEGLLNNEINFNDNDINNHEEESVKTFENMSKEEFKQFLEENNLTEDDIDFIESSDD